mgnify:CR=1 FL=1
MSFHEIKKDTKIVDEILLYLLKNDHDEVSINIKREQDEVFITFECTKLSDEIIKSLDMYINKERELEMEEYGWELMGESDGQSDLSMVGLLIDNLTIDNSNPDYTVLSLVRQYEKKLKK